MKKLKQIKEESKSKVSPVIKKRGFIAKGFVPPLETKPTRK
jgi:hypothetical protein